MENSVFFFCCFVIIKLFFKSKSIFKKEIILYSFIGFKIASFKKAKVAERRCFQSFEAVLDVHFGLKKV